MIRHQISQQEKWSLAVALELPELENTPTEEQVERYLRLCGGTLFTLLKYFEPTERDAILSALTQTMAETSKLVLRAAQHAQEKLHKGEPTDADRAVVEAFLRELSGPARGLPDAPPPT